MEPFVVTILLATADPKIGELYRAGVSSVRECESMMGPRGVFGPNGTNRKILDGRCDASNKFKGTQSSLIADLHIAWIQTRALADQAEVAMDSTLHEIKLQPC